MGRRPLATAGECRAVNNERARTRTTAMARTRGSPADRQATGERVGRRPLSTAGECRAVDNCDGDGEGEGDCDDDSEGEGEG